MNIIAVSHNPTINALGRVYSMRLLTDVLGWDLRIIGVSKGEIWEPLRGTKFAQCVELFGSIDELRKSRDRIVAEADVIVCVKAHPTSLAVSRILCDGDVALLVDIDDPDLEFHIGRNQSLWRRILLGPILRSRGMHPSQLRKVREDVMQLSCCVSNPFLQSVYGGVVIPHVRDGIVSQRRERERWRHVAFIGTPRQHKGLRTARKAIETLAPDGFTLTVTADAPGDAKPWERWVGVTSLAIGREILRRHDIAIVPSLGQGYGAMQLPVKVIDAMSLGVLVVASDIGPIRWAVGDAGVLVDGLGVRDFVRGLRRADSPMSNARVRQGLERFAAMFSPTAVAPKFSAWVGDSVSI